MVVQVYISGVSGDSEVKSRQQRVLSIMDSKNIRYEIVDITGENSEYSKKFMHTNSTSNGATTYAPKPKCPLPPQFFNDDVYCGDYESFDVANELGELKKFLKIEDEVVPELTEISQAEIKLQLN